MTKKSISLVMTCAFALLIAGCGSKEKYAGEWKDICGANLNEINGAKQQWALEERKQKTDVPTHSQIFGKGSFMKAEPVCPAEGRYSLNQVGSKPTCSVPSHNQ